MYPSTAGYDGAIHMSEEASNATTAVPFAIISSLAMAIVLGFGKHDSVIANSLVTD